MTDVIGFEEHSTLLL
jgi:hypothetical protein